MLQGRERAAGGAAGGQAIGMCWKDTRKKRRAALSLFLYSPSRPIGSRDGASGMVAGVGEAGVRWAGVGGGNVREENEKVET